MTSDDPALKYLPKDSKNSIASGTHSSVDVDHGIFTKIAYGTAWAVSITGTIVGCLMIVQALEGRAGPDMGAAISGLGIVAFSWISACGVGTLAEISRKLTHTHLGKEGH